MVGLALIGFVGMLVGLVGGIIIRPLLWLAAIGILCMCPIIFSENA
jgi:hypothetical protein